MITEYLWRQTSSFPDKTWEIAHGSTRFGIIDKDLDGRFVCHFKNKVYYVKDNSVYNKSKALVAEFFETSWNEYTIKINSNEYRLNKSTYDIYNLTPIVEFHSDSIISSKTGKLKTHTDQFIDILFACLFYIRYHIYKNQIIA